MEKYVGYMNITQTYKGLQVIAFVSLLALKRADVKVGRSNVHYVKVLKLWVRLQKTKYFPFQC